MFISCTFKTDMICELYMIRITYKVNHTIENFGVNFDCSLLLKILPKTLLFGFNEYINFVNIKVYNR